MKRMVISKADGDSHTMANVNLNVNASVSGSEY